MIIMNIKTIICSLLLIFCMHFAFGQGTIKGVVTGDEWPDGVIGATVAINDGGTVTEYDGSYEVSVPAGQHTINISYTGLETYTETFTIADGEVKQLDVYLKAEAILLETAVITSGKYEKPLGEVTVSMEVIKPALAQSTNSNSLDQVLDRVPGVTIVDGQANIRGGSGFSYGAGSRVLLLVDDIPILDGGAGFPNWSDVPVENISQVEVVKGAASALYGSSALNGIINVRTAYAKSEPETQVAMYTDVFYRPKDTLKHWWKDPGTPTPMKVGANVVHRQKFGKLDWVFGSTGYLDYRYIKNARDNKFRLTNKLRYRINENLNIGAYINANIGSSNTVFLWQNSEEGAYIGDPGNMTSTQSKRFNIDPFVTYQDDKGNKYRYIGRYFRTSNENANDQDNFTNLFYNEFQYQKNFEKPGIIMTTGVVSTNTNVNGALYGAFDFKSTNLAYYLQADKKFYFGKDAEGNVDETKNALNLSAGFRYEFNQLTGPTEVNGIDLGDGKDADAKPVFRIGLNYQPAEFTYIRASWGQGYRYPTVAEKFITTTVAGFPIIPNPTLTPETGWSAEIGARQGYKIGGLKGFLDISAFWTEYQDMMEFNITREATAIGFKSQNVGNTRIPGMEVSIAGQTSTNALPVRFFAGYTYINPQFKVFEEAGIPWTLTNPSPDGFTEGQINDYNSTAESNILKYRNQHTFKADIETTVQRFTFGISLNGASKMVAIDELLDFITNTNHRETAEGYAIFDARVGYQVAEGVKVAIVGKNLANKEYASRPGLLQPPMSFSLRIDASF